MARKRRGYRRGFRAAKRKYRGKKGILMGVKVMDIGQGCYNAKYLGYFDALGWLAKGDYDRAQQAVVNPMGDTSLMLNLSLGNALIGVNRKILRMFGGKFVRRYFA